MELSEQEMELSKQEIELLKQEMELFKQTSDQKTYFTKCFSFDLRITKSVVNTRNGIIQI